jgi:hypothetical protein
MLDPGEAGVKPQFTRNSLRELQMCFNTSDDEDPPCH